MKILNTSLPILLLTILSAFSAPADVFDDVCKSIQTGDAGGISKHFGSNVEMTIDGQEGVYSKSQAEVILKDFFTKNPAKTITISHRSNTGSERSFAIANYVSQAGTAYRITIYIKTISGKPQIQELKFEKP